MRAHMGITPLFCLALSACALGPDYTRPELPVPEGWSTTATPTDGATTPSLARAPRLDPIGEIDIMVQPRWWAAFGDPELDALLHAAVIQNLDLKIAAANLEQSRAVARVAAAPLWGTVALQPRYDKTKQSRRIVEEPSAALRELGVTAPPNPSKQYSLPIDVSYEFDLWGRLRRGREAATAEFHATREDGHAIYLSLLVTVAGNYFDVREIDERIALAERAQVLGNETLRIVEKRYEAGMIAQTDVLRVRAQEAQLDGDVIELKRRRVERQHALAVLLGQAPGVFEATAKPTTRDPGLAPLASIPSAKAQPGHPWPAPLASIPSAKPLRGVVWIPQVTPGLPSSLLARRPDVRAAEYRLIAANARIGEAKAAFFPTLSLTGEYGYQSRALDNLISSKSITWGINPQLYVPLFDGGKRRGQLQVAHAATEEAVERYRLTLLRAFEEVENALAAGSYHAQQQTQIARAVAALNAAHVQVRRQYEHGQVSLLDVLDAERSLLAVEERALALYRARLDAVLFLYKALGGGWEQGAFTGQ